MLKSSLITTAYALPSGGSVAIGGKPNRLSLTIGRGDGKDFSFSFGTDPGIAGGVYIPAAQAFIHFSRNDYGSGIDGDIVVYDKAATASKIVIIEAFAAP